MQLGLEVVGVCEGVGTHIQVVIAYVMHACLWQVYEHL